MRITRKQLRRIIKEEAAKLREQPQQMTLNQSGVDAVLAMADQIDPMFQTLRKTAGQSDVSFDPLFEEVEEILLDLPSYLREIAKKMKAQGVEGGLKEQMDHYEWRHQEDQKDLADHRADEVFDIIDQDEGLPGREVVARALRSSVFGGAAAGRPAATTTGHWHHVPADGMAVLGSRWHGWRQYGADCAGRQYGLIFARRQV